KVEGYVAGEWSGARAVPKDQSRMAGQLKVLQVVAGKLNRLLDVRQIGEVLMSELRGLIDSDAFRVPLVDSAGVTLRPIAFDADDLRVMEALSSHVAVAVENARLFEEERQSAETANALLRVSQTLTRCSDVEGVLDALVGSCADTFEGARVSAWMRERDGSF